MVGKRRVLVLFLVLLSVDARLVSVAGANTLAAARSSPIQPTQPAIRRISQFVGLKADTCSTDSDCQHNGTCGEDNGGEMKCTCNRGSTGDNCETLDGQGNMSTLGIDKGEPCGINYECNNLNIFRINLGVYGFIISVWGAFIPIIMAYNELLCAQDIFPVMIFSLITVVGGWLDLRGAAPHTALQLGGIWTNIIILIVTIILSMLVAYGKMAWVADHLDFLGQVVRERQLKLIKARKDIDEHRYNVEMRSKFAELTPHDTDGLDSAIERHDTLKDEMVEIKKGAAHTASAPRILVFVFFGGIVLPVILAFMMTDIPALFSSFDTENGGYTYNAQQPIILMVGLFVHWIFMWYTMVSLKRTMLSAIAEHVDHEKAQNAVANATSATTWIILGLGVSHIVLYLSTAQWGNLPLIQDGDHTTILCFIGLIWMFCLLMAAIRVRNGTETSFGGISFLVCKSSQEREKVKQLRMFSRQMSVSKKPRVESKSIVHEREDRYPLELSLASGVSHAPLSKSRVSSPRFPNPLDVVEEEPHSSAVYWE